MPYGQLEVLTAIHLIYIGTQETGQITNEMPIGIIVLSFILFVTDLFSIRARKKCT